MGFKGLGKILKTQILATGKESFIPCRIIFVSVRHEARGQFFHRASKTVRRCTHVHNVVIVCCTFGTTTTQAVLDHGLHVGSKLVQIGGKGSRFPHNVRDCFSKNDRLGETKGLVGIKFFQDTHNIYPGAVLRHPVILGVQDLVIDTNLPILLFFHAYTQNTHLNNFHEVYREWN